MGIFKKLFGRGEGEGHEALGGQHSLRDFAVSAGIPLAKDRCDLCGDIFDWPQGMVAVTIPGDPVMDQVTGGKEMQQALRHWKLDVGGYCPKCKRKMCGKHARFVDAGFLGVVPGCAQCGSRLQAQ